MDIVLDFDGTITTRDTITTLAEYAISKNGGAADWANIVEAYPLDHERYAAEYSPRAADRTTAEAELTFLSSLREVELASLNRVQDSGLFRALSPADFSRFGEEAVESGVVQTRRGFRELTARPPGRLAVLSVNWSADFIRGCCGGGGSTGRELDVFANAIGFPGGRIVRAVPGGEEPLLTARDKYAALEVVARLWDKGVEELVYVGDSVTDLECLLASKGIVITDDDAEGSLMKTLGRLGLDVRHVSLCTTDFRLAWARDFREIVDSGILGGPSHNGGLDGLA